MTYASISRPNGCGGDDELVELEPKAFEVLRHLLHNPDRLISKQELFDTVWERTAVTDNALTRVVAQLRRALGDDARDARYIETVPTRGYRFIGRIERLHRRRLRVRRSFGYVHSRVRRRLTKPRGAAAAERTDQEGAVPPSS